MAQQKSSFVKIPASIIVLKALSYLIPTNFLRTFFYLNLIYKPRRLLQNLIGGFYRIDHVYSVIGEATRYYKGSFSILEFGVAGGGSFTKMLYATKYLKVADRVTVHGFDSFEGMHSTDDRRDLDLVTDDDWVEGQFKSSYEKLNDYCRKHYPNYRLHKGMFHETLTDALIAELERTPPILVWIDCDYYTSSRVVMERLVPVLPNGCVIYFDEPEFNYGSRFSGEMRLIHEINQGEFGSHIELVLDPALSLNTYRIYRFINADRDSTYEPVSKFNKAVRSKTGTNDSPLP